MYIRLFVAIGLLFIVNVSCTSSVKIISSELSSNIVIDGNHDDWNGRLKYLESEKIAIGFQNEQENLYFCFVTSDRKTVMKIMSMGLTVWFHPGNNEQTIGLQFPQRMDKVAPRIMMGKNRNDNGDSDFEMTITAMMENQGEFVLVDDEGVIIYASPIGSNDGYELKIGGINRQFVYEAKVPIGNNSFAQVPINVFPDEKFIVSFESGELDMEELRDNMGSQSGMGQGSGMHGSGEGMHGQMNGSSQTGFNRVGLERVNFDVNVKLAK